MSPAGLGEADMPLPFQPALLGLGALAPGLASAGLWPVVLYLDCAQLVPPFDLL